MTTKIHDETTNRILQDCVVEVDDWSKDRDDNIGGHTDHDQTQRFCPSDHMEAATLVLFCEDCAL